MTDPLETLKEISQELKKTENEIKLLKEGKSFENPVNNEFIRTQKCMGYENVLEIVKKYIASKKEG